MKAIIKFFLDNSKLTYLITLFLIMFGANGLKNLLREENPNVNIGQARITTYYPGATAEEVEIEVTKKIEDKIKEVSGIKKVRSVSQTNISIIKAEIDIDNFDQEEVMDDLKDAVEMVNNLPTTASKPEFLEIDTKEFSVIEVAIVGSNENRKRDAYVEFLEDELKDIKGVLKVEKYGYAEREFTIKMNLEKLVQYNVGIDEVVDALQSKNISVPAGSLKSYENQALVRIDAKSKNKEELENVLVRSNFEDKKIYVKDIAEVFDYIEDQETYTKINGEDCTIMAIKKQSSVDTIHLSKEVKAKLEEYSKSEQGKDFKIIYFVNAAIDVESKFDIIVSNVVFGVVTVLIFMMIFLPGKIGIVSSMCLPIIVMATLGLMPILEINIDSISMLAIIIALGMMVDNSVLVSENFAQLIEEGSSIYDAALGCAAKFWIPITVTTLTTIFAFMPMLLTKGVMGLFISSIPILVSLTLAISIAECLFLMPARLRAIGGSIVKAQNKRKKSGKEGVDWFSTIIIKFEKLVYVCVSHRYISLCCFIGILMFSFYILGKSQFILFPPEDVDEYNVKYETGIGDSLEKTSELTTKLTNDIYNAIGRENIENVVAYIGQSGTGLLEDLQQNHHTAELKIYIYKDKSYILNYKDVLAKLRSMDTSYLTKFEVTEKYAGPDVGKAIEANFRSNNESKLYEVIDYMKTELAKIDGIIDIESNDYKNDDEIFIRLDYEKIARIGLSTSYISNLIKASISGIEIAMITLNNREFSMLVKFDDSFKKYDKDLQKIKIRDNDGNLIPLAEIATVERVTGSRMKHRLNFKKNVALRANVNVNKITALEGNAKVSEIFNKIKDQYPEVSLQFGGEQENAEESFSSLVIAFKFAFILIIGCLVFVLNSYVKPLIIMTTVPLGVVGFAIAFYLHQRPISFLAVIGVIGLVGVVTDVGIILISFVDMLKKQYRKTMTLNQILAKASGARLRAVVASAVTTVSGLLPTAYGIGGRDASLIPVTLAMAWGLVSSTLLSLLWMPCAYGIMDDGYQLLRKARVSFWKFKRRKIN